MYRVFIARPDPIDATKTMRWTVCENETASHALYLVERLAMPGDVFEWVKLT